MFDNGWNKRHNSFMKKYKATFVPFSEFEPSIEHEIEAVDMPAALLQLKQLEIKWKGKFTNCRTSVDKGDNKP